MTISEAIARHKDFGKLTSLVPGSWINANFNVWIGAPEDNRAWDYLHQARDFYAQNAARATEAQRKLAFEEMLIAEGSDWNWWYGPEHHSANDRDFDELYRKHLSNVYQALGAVPPDYLAQPISWSGSASFVYSADRLHSSANRGRQSALLRVDGRGRLHRRSSRRRHARQAVPAGLGVCRHRLHPSLRTPGLQGQSARRWISNWWSTSSRGHAANNGHDARCASRLQCTSASCTSGKLRTVAREALWRRPGGPTRATKLALIRNFEFKVPLTWLLATPGASSSTAERKAGATAMAATSKLRLRFSLWQNRLPVDSLPMEGWIELQVVSEGDLLFGA